MRRPIIAGNWKLYKTPAETEEFIGKLKSMVPQAVSSLGADRKPEVVVAPTGLALETAIRAARGTEIRVSAQNCAWEDEGAFTGELSSKHLKTAGVTHVIIGHSERRQFFGETDETVNKRIRSALKNGLHVIFCIGETLAEREGNKTNDVLQRQIKGGLKDITESQLDSITIAYEPVWAIGTGKVATPEQAEDAHQFCRKMVWEGWGMNPASKIRILYGGSVKPDNAKGLFSKPNIDGALIGGASLKADSFTDIIKGL